MAAKGHFSENKFVCSQNPFVTALTYLPYLGVSAEAHNQRNIYLHCGGGSLQKKEILEVPPPQEWIDNDPLFTCLVLESSRDSNRRHFLLHRVYLN